MNISSWEGLLNELAHPIRVQILISLTEQAKTFTSLSKIIEASNSELSRHLNRLNTQNLLIRNGSNKKYELTPLSKLIIRIYQPLHFILLNNEFFKYHNLTMIPDHLVDHLNLLADAEYIEGTGLVMQKMQACVERARKSVFVMIDNPFPFGKEGLDVHYIVNSRLLKQRDQVEGKNRTTDARIHDTIPVALFYSDFGEALLFFSDLHDKIDYSTVFYAHSSDSHAFTYITEIWDYYWQTGQNPN